MQLVWATFLEKLERGEASGKTDLIAVNMVHTGVIIS